ncbi:MAG TPA: acyl-CoA dehydrogenase family protein [Dehalococcoidia bacterium]|nr:acyl-CoA dehydrogenase family protein [Dehalococcoidia bacterium]
MYLELNKTLTPEQNALREQAHRFAAEVLRPASVQLDRMTPEEVIAPGSQLWDVLRQAYQQGYHLRAFPEALGGAGLGPLEGHIVGEELGWGSCGLSISIGVTAFPFSFAATYAAMTGNKALMDEIVMPFVNDREGKYIGCWAVTEPDHGSDTLLFGTAQFRDPNITFQVHARRDGDDWIISGQKSAWVSNGTIATHACMFLGVDPSRGMSGGGVAVVPLNLPGVTKGPPLNKLGQRDLNQGQIFLDDVRIPRHYMLVDPDAYPAVIDSVLAGANAGMSTTFTGVARAAFEEALAYTRQRVQGGKPICEHQLVQDKLFHMFRKVEAARALSRAVSLYNRTTSPPSTEYSIAAKVQSTQTAFEVASDAIQLMGGYGLSKDFLIEKLFRDARASLIEDGVNEVLGLAAARRIVDHYRV